MRSNGGRFESGGSEAGTGAGVSGGYGAALGARPSLEDVSPPGAGERHNNGGISALQARSSQTYHRIELWDGELSLCT